ncbi:MAG: response regulator [Bdellovibrionota bacterium]
MEVKGKEKPLALVVDDDEFFLRIFERILGKFGFQVESTQNEKDFIQRLKAKTPAACFIDININGHESGYPLVRSVRNKFGPELLLFVVSGKSDPKAIAHAIECGATDFILKPIDNEVFASKLGRFFNVDSVREDELSYINAPDQGFPAELTVPMNMLAIDEMGATFHSPHLMPKGTIFYAEGELMNSILGMQKRQMMTVVTTEVFMDSTGYKVQAEFDDPSEELLTKLRRWIRSQRV